MFAFYFYWLGLRDIRGRMPRKLGRVSWTEILYIFVVLFLIIYGTYFIMRRAIAFGARVRGLDHCARCTAQRLWRAVGLFELYEHMWRTCLDSVADRADITPHPHRHPVSVCTFGCIAHVTYRNWSKILEYDFVVSRAWLAERYGGQSHCRVRGENSIIVIASACSRYELL